MWLIILISLIAILQIALFIIYAIRDWLRRGSANYEEYDFQFENSKPKIGAEVSNQFHDEVKRYCDKHHMTISELIRMSVKVYMDSNK